jgi:hypothetical protein
MLPRFCPLWLRFEQGRLPRGVLFGEVADEGSGLQWVGQFDVESAAFKLQMNGLLKLLSSVASLAGVQLEDDDDKETACASTQPIEALPPVFMPATADERLLLHRCWFTAVLGRLGYCLLERALANKRKKSTGVGRKPKKKARPFRVLQFASMKRYRGVMLSSLEGVMKSELGWSSW